MAIILTLMLMPCLVRPILINRAWMALGTISYSVYLIHGPVMWHVMRAFDVSRPLGGRPYAGWDEHSLAAVALTASATLVLAVSAYALLERPFLRRKVRVHELAPLPESPAPAPAAILLDPHVSVPASGNELFAPVAHP